jgi:hypothetical protein
MNKYLSLFLVIFLIGCIKTYPDFEDGLNKFDQKFVAHFPKNHGNLVSYYCSFPDPNSNIRMGVSLNATFSIKDVDSLKELYSSQSQKVTFQRDSCNFILPVRHYSNYKIDMYIINECSDTSKNTPIPNFD